MKISDSIANYILELLEEENSAEIKRNELANTLGCVPSQINYVLTSRFTPEQGYRIESRRGGGGYIRITRVYHDSSSQLITLVNAIGDAIDGNSARVILNHLLTYKLASEETVKAMAAAISDQSLRIVPQGVRESIRADLLKNIMITLL